LIKHTQEIGEMCQTANDHTYFSGYINSLSLPPRISIMAADQLYTCSFCGVQKLNLKSARDVLRIIIVRP